MIIVNINKAYGGLTNNIRLLKIYPIVYERINPKDVATAAPFAPYLGIRKKLKIIFVITPISDAKAISFGLSVM